MSDIVLVALLSLIGTITGSFAGILVANKLSNYRIEQLEKKVEKFVDNIDDLKIRLVKVEESTKSAHKRLDDITEQLNIHERRN